MRLSLRPASETDFAFCESLSRTNMSSYLAARGIAWDPRRYRVSWTGFENFVISAESETVGLLRLLVVDGVLEIRDLQIVPSHRRQGIGAWAVTHAKSEAVTRGIGELRLRVYEENPAKLLYARLGFRVVAIDGGTVHMSYALPPGNSFKPNPHRG